MNTITVIGRSSIGMVATDGEMPFSWYLTDCCAASAKGSSNSPTGACCRACYAEIPVEFGGIYDEKFDGPLQPLTDADRALLASKGTPVAAGV